MNCKRCGYCCTLVPKISFLEKMKIMLSGNFNFTEKDTRGRICIKLIDSKCFFLEDSDDCPPSCRIYSIRPKVCRDFPSKDAEECNVDKRSFKERVIGKD